MSGTPRGQCTNCNSCPRFGLPPSNVRPPDLLRYCRHCGCDCALHEALDAKEVEAEEEMREKQRPGRVWGS